jgi:FtsZ-interacting cell division protein ZipA
MMYTRRSALETLAGAAGSFLVLQDQPPMPRPRVRTPVNPPEPAVKEDKDASPGISQKVSLQAKEKELRQTLEQLYAKVNDLKGQLEPMHTAEVFSVTVFKQTQEIERLAKRLKSCARG